MNDEFTAKKTLFKTYQVVWYVISVIEVLLLLRIIFRLLSANPGSGFVSLIYSLSSIFVIPFSAIFPSPAEGNYVLDTPAIIAFGMYPVLAYLLVKFLQLFKPTSATEVQSVDHTDIPQP